MLNGLTREELQSYLKKGDPIEGKCLYVEWIYKQYYNRHFRLEDVSTLREDLDLFNTNKHRFTGTNKDINSFTYSTLKVFLRDMFELKLVEDTTSLSSTDVKVLYDGPLGKLSIPLTEEASCILGKGTKWCTASTTSGNMFNKYNKEGPLYIWVDNNWNKGKLKELGNRSKKFQLHFQSGQYMDELDNPIDSNILSYFMLEHPVVKKIFENYEKSMTTPKEIAEYVIRVDPYNNVGYVTKYVIGNDKVELSFLDYGTYEQHKKSNIRDIVKKDLIDSIGENTDVETFSKVYDRFHSTIVPLVDKYIVTNLDKAFQFAILRNETWVDNGLPDLDIEILSNPKYTVD
jgi:hypothetical protein